MASLSDFFKNTRKTHKFEFGTRVFGYYQTIPFIGSVGFDGVVSELEGPMVTVTLDLPIKLIDCTISVVRVKRKDIKPLVDFG